MSITIRPIEADIKKDTDSIGKMDPYVVCIIGQDKAQTKKSKGTHPTWSETLELKANNKDLHIEVWDKDKFSSDDLVGKAHIDLTPFFNHSKNDTNVTVNLEDKKGEVAATLTLHIKYNGPTQPNQGQPNSGWGAFNQQGGNQQGGNQQGGGWGNQGGNQQGGWGGNQGGNQPNPGWGNQGGNQQGGWGNQGGNGPNPGSGGSGGFML